MPCERGGVRTVPLCSCVAHLFTLLRKMSALFIYYSRCDASPLSRCNTIAKGFLQNAQDVQNQEPDLKGILPNFVNYETDPSLKRHTALYTGIRLRGSRVKAKAVEVYTPHVRRLCASAEWACDADGGVACHVLRVRYVSVCVSHGA